MFQVNSALTMRLDPKIAAEWTDEIMAARTSLHAGKIDLNDIVEDWVPTQFNTSATLFENVLYGLPTDGREIASGPCPSNKESLLKSLTTATET